MLTINQTPEAVEKFAAYPEAVKPKLKKLRALLIDAASEIESIQEIEESLKWGEPSYKTKQGSAIRMDWKSKTPGQFAVYFNCQTRLVETFRHVYGDLFHYEKNRAVVFQLDDELPEKELKTCFKAALQYHLLKNTPLLGM